jgi:predicted amidohydrolase
MSGRDPRPARAPDGWSDYEQEAVSAAQSVFFDTDTPDDPSTLDHGVAWEKHERSMLVHHACYLMGVEVAPANATIRAAFARMSDDEIHEFVHREADRIRKEMLAIRVAEMPQGMREILKQAPDSVISTMPQELQDIVEGLKRGDFDDVESDGGSVVIKPDGSIVMESGNMVIVAQAPDEKPLTSDLRLDKMEALRKAVQERGGTAFQGSTTLNDLFAADEDEDDLIN